MTDNSEGEQVVTGQVTGMDETEAGISLTTVVYLLGRLSVLHNNGNRIT